MLVLTCYLCNTASRSMMNSWIKHQNQLCITKTLDKYTAAFHTSHNLFFLEFACSLLPPVCSSIIFELVAFSLYQVAPGTVIDGMLMTHTDRPTIKARLICQLVYYFSFLQVNINIQFTYSFIRPHSRFNWVCLFHTDILKKRQHLI